MADEQLSFIIADLSRFTAGETVALALDIQANLQEDTPRDLGWARANWVMSVGAPAEDPAVAAISNPTPAQISQALTKQTQSLSEVTAYSDISQGAIFTTNNVPYIGRLNEGWSKQAGAAFIQRSVADAINYNEVARGGSYRATREVDNLASASRR